MSPCQNGCWRYQESCPASSAQFSMITYFADVKFCRSLFINLARPCPPLCCPSEKLSMELFPVIFPKKNIQSWIFQQICNRICIGIKYWKTIFHFGGLPAPILLQTYCSLHLRYQQFTVGQDCSYLFPPPSSLSYVFIEIGKYFLEFLTYFLADGLLTKTFFCLNLLFIFIILFLYYFVDYIMWIGFSKAVYTSFLFLNIFR